MKEERGMAWRRDEEFHEGGDEESLCLHPK